MKTNETQMHRNFKITTGRYGFNVESINCFGCRSMELAMRMIDIYIDGDKSPQCLGL